jgi:hypothetical protein
MKSRCLNPNSVGYRDYGGRGIRICRYLRDEFPNFLATMGERPEDQTIHRIDNDGNYSCGGCEECVANGWPMNVKWATRAEHALHKRPCSHARPPELRAEAVRRYLAGGISQDKLAAEYDVSQTAISKWVRLARTRDP